MLYTYLLLIQLISIYYWVSFLYLHKFEQIGPENDTETMSNTFDLNPIKFNSNDILPFYLRMFSLRSTRCSEQSRHSDAGQLKIEK